MPPHKSAAGFIKCVRKNYAENLNISNLHDNVLLWCGGGGGVAGRGGRFRTVGRELITACVCGVKRNLFSYSVDCREDFLFC